jgi:hypothetical protein
MLPPGDVRRILAANRGPPSARRSGIPRPQTQRPGSTSHKDIIFLNGKKYIQADTHSICFNISTSFTTQVSSLVDHGANGGMAGEDVRLIETGEKCADVRGINNHTVTNLPISTVAGVVHSQYGPVIAITHQYAYHGKGKTIHSSTQIEHYGNVVDDRSTKVPGGQHCIKTFDGYVLPLQIRAGLVYLDMHPPSDQELASLPYVILTSEVDWDPSILDHELDLATWSSQFPKHVLGFPS